jgi:hypothetical protein
MAEPMLLLKILTVDSTFMSVLAALGGLIVGASTPALSNFQQGSKTQLLLRLWRSWQPF